MNNFKRGNIAVIEFKSVSRGITVTDSMLKESSVNIVLSSSLCPGKYLTIIEGEVSALNSAIKVAEKLGGRHVFDTQLISGINLKVIDAISGNIKEILLDAMGIVESPQMANLISSSDIAADSAKVEFIDYRLARGCGVNSFYVLTGELSSVNEAVKNAVNFLGKNGSLIAYKIIPNPDREVWRWVKSSLCRC